jgi:hypothetical protein
VSAQLVGGTFTATPIQNVQALPAEPNLEKDKQAIYT